MIHSFDNETARVIGVKGAVLLHHIGWWVEKNKANEVNYHDGSYWTYNTIKAFTVLFPFWSKDVIKKELIKLEKDGYIKTGNYNKVPTDRTKWYTLTEKAEGILHHSNVPIRTLDSADLHLGTCENPLSSYNSKKRTSIKHSNIARTREEDCSPELAEALTAFAEHRKKMRKPMTDYAKKLLIGKLQKLAATEAEQVAILNQSIENGWQGIFPLGGDKGRGSRSAADMAEGVKQKLRDRGLLHDGEGEDSGNGNAGGRPSWFS